MMNIYRRHYWSIWVDFIEAFEQLQFKGVPLPLMIVDIYRYLNHDLINLMNQVPFDSCLKNKINNETDIQCIFDQIVARLKKAPSKKPPQRKGKIVLDNFVLRLPEETIVKHFNIDQIMYIYEGKSFVNTRGLQYYGTDNDKMDNRLVVKDFIEKAKSIFSTFVHHPIFGNSSFQEKFMKDIPEMIDKLVAVNNFFDRTPVGCVVIGAYETFLIRSLIFVAHTRGIPTLWLEHGIIGDKHNYGWLPVLATKHAVYGQFEVDWYMNRGVSKERLEITGNAMFDRIYLNKHMSKVEFNQKLGLDSQKYKVLFATNEIILKDKWREMAEYLLQHPSIEIILKTHPPGTENERSLFNELRAKYSSIKLIDKWDFNIHDILPNVDIVVIDVSTVGLEAMLFNKPVVCLIYPDRVAYNYEYYSLINDFIDSDPIRAAKIIMQLLTDENVKIVNKKKREIFLSYAYPQTLSSEKLVNVIKNMI